MSWDYDTVGKTVVPISDTGYSLTHGVFKVNDERSEIVRAWIYMQNVHSSYDMVIDSFSVKKLTKRCTEDNFIRNGNFTSGYSKYWRSYPEWEWKNVNYSIVTVGNGNKAIEISSKTKANQGLEQVLYLDKNCIKSGQRYLVQADFQMISTSDDSVVRCHSEDHPLASKCGEIRINTSGGGWHFISNGKIYPNLFLFSTLQCIDNLT